MPIYYNGEEVGNFINGGAADMPIATKTTLGGVKVGDGVNVAADGTISVDGETVDAALSETSENPVQNKVVTAKINEVATAAAEAATAAGTAQNTASAAATAASAAGTAANNAVKFSGAQSLTTEQKEQARENINAKANTDWKLLEANITDTNSHTYTIDNTVYKNLYIEVLLKSTNGAYLGTTIPLKALGTTAKRYQQTDEANYISYNLTWTGTTLTVAISTRAQNTASIVYIAAIP